VKLTAERGKGSVEKGKVGVAIIASTLLFLVLLVIAVVAVVLVRRRGNDEESFSSDDAGESIEIEIGPLEDIWATGVGYAKEGSVYHPDDCTGETEEWRITKGGPPINRERGARMMALCENRGCEQ
jgi:hypothetical protein